jgi:hypothetical protein
MGLIEIFKICKNPEQYDDIDFLKNTLSKYLHTKKHKLKNPSYISLFLLNNPETIQTYREAMKIITDDVIMDILMTEKANCSIACNMLQAGCYVSGIKYVFDNLLYFNRLPDRYTHYEKHGFKLTKSKLVKNLQQMCMLNDDIIKQHEEFYIYIDVLIEQLDNINKAIFTRRDKKENDPEIQHFYDWETKYFIPMLEKFIA